MSEHPEPNPDRLSGSRRTCRTASWAVVVALAVIAAARAAVLGA